MKVLGLDVGRAHTGVVVWDMLNSKLALNATIDLPLAKARKIRKYNPIYYRLDLACSILREHISDQNDIILAVVEDYIYGTKPVTAEDIENMDRDPLKLAEMHGSMCAVIAGRNVPMIKVSPSQMKYFMTGDGVADKRKMIQGVYNSFKVSMPDEHQYDALCAAHIGRYFVHYSINPNKEIFHRDNYKKMVCNSLMFDRRFEGVSDEIKRRVVVSMKGETHE